MVLDQNKDSVAKLHMSSPDIGSQNNLIDQKVLICLVGDSISAIYAPFPNLATDSKQLCSGNVA